MDLQTLGRVVAIAGLGLVLLGAIMWLGGRLGLGSLPGDIRLTGDGWSCYVPVLSMLLISLALTVLVNVIWRLFR